MKWTENNTKELIRLYRAMTTTELAKRFGTTPKAVQGKVERLGLHKGKQRLTGEQKLWLELNFPNMSDKTLCVILGIGLTALNDYRKRLGLKKTKQYLSECRAYAGKKRQEKAKEKERTIIKNDGKTKDEH